VSGALDGDLDPTLGMYWAWNSGYIQFKMEGMHSQCNTRRHEFQFHLGGYLPGEATAQYVNFLSSGLSLQIDLKKWIDFIHFSETNSVTVPGIEAVKLSNQLPLLFK
jgi:hypothetical protein